MGRMAVGGLSETPGRLREKLSNGVAGTVIHVLRIIFALSVSVFEMCQRTLSLYFSISMKVFVVSDEVMQQWWRWGGVMAYC